MYIALHYQGFIQWGKGGSFPTKMPSFHPPQRKLKEKEGEKNSEREGGSVCVFLVLVGLVLQNLQLRITANMMKFAVTFVATLSDIHWLNAFQQSM